MRQDFQGDVLVSGNGLCARQMAETLAARGLRVFLVSETSVSGLQMDGVTVVSGSRLIACSGDAGAFEVILERDGQPTYGQAAAVVVAAEPLLVPNFKAYGLAPSDRVMAVSDLVRILENGNLTGIIKPDSRVVFLNGWHHETHPVMADRMLGLCLRLQQNRETRTCFLTGNLKVAVDGVEACSEEARAAGTFFLKFTDRFPRLETLADGRVAIDCWDEAGRLDLRLIADAVIVDEEMEPDGDWGRLLQVLRLLYDPFGSASTDNVRRRGGETTRRGIFVTGATRTLLSEAGQQAEAAHVALKVAGFLAGLDRDPPPKVEIDPSRCARCLTCYRSCPHAAMEMSPHLMVLPQACQGCGICVAGCPNQAIKIQDPQLEGALQTLSAQPDTTSAGGFVPRIVVFCCRRSTVPAREEAVALGRQIPPGLVFVEGLCGGAFSVQHLLSAFDAAADGVMVLTCHPGNCHSEHGTRHAQKRAAEVIKALGLVGLESERVQFNTLASNMSEEFVSLVNSFHRQIASLGPWLNNS